MSLPKINQTPKYELKVPSTGKSVRYRPYLVKEEKALLLAYESKDIKLALQAILDTVDACVEVDANSLTVYDVEYIFMQLRTKSVGETARIGVPCTTQLPESEELCRGVGEVEVDLSKLELQYPEQQIDHLYKLQDDIYAELTHPTFASIAYSELTDNTGSSEQFDLGLATMRHVIKAVVYNDQRIVFADESIEDQDEFISSLTDLQIKEIGEFVESVPYMEHTVEFDCEKCGEHITQTLKGIYNFF